jgi:hypothetical protein
VTSMDGRSRTSSTAVPDAVLTPPSMESCASRHLHVSATAPALLYLPTSRQSLLHCSIVLHPCRSLVGRRCNEGNAKGLLGCSYASDLHGRRKCKGIVGTIPACVRGISASDLQGWPLSHVLCFAAPARPGAMEEMQKDCWEQSLPCTSEQSLRFEVDVLPLAAYS